MRRLLAVVLLAVAAVAAVVPAGAASAQTGLSRPQPTASIGGLVEITPGELLTVRGTDWPVPSNVTVTLCGNGGTGGSENCDLPGSRATGIQANGEFFLQMVVGTPPVPCPCVLVVESNSTETQVRLPVRVTGVEERTDVPLPVEIPTTSLGLTALEVSSEGGPRSWFGAAPEQTLVVEVENIGTADTGPGVLEVTYGKGDRPDQEAGSAEFKALAPGERVRVTMSFRLDTLSFGTYTIRGQVEAVNAAGTFTTETEVRPWAWLIVAVILFQVGFVIIRNRVRARAQAGGDDAAGEETPADAEPATVTGQAQDPAAEPPAAEPPAAEPPADS